MDARIEQLIQQLQSLGYTDKYVEDHWERDWRGKRWYGFEGTSVTIFQIVTANVYTRIVVLDKESFAFFQYPSEKHPGRPKTDFYCDAELVSTRRKLNDLPKLVRDLEFLAQEEEAA